MSFPTLVSCEPEPCVISEKTAQLFGLESFLATPTAMTDDKNKGIQGPPTLSLQSNKRWSIPPSLSTSSFVVILVSGLSGSGKNFVADEIIARWLVLKRQLYPNSMAFATPLKIGLHLNHYDDYSWTDVFQTKPPIIRMGLQEEGQVAREKYGIEHWIDQLHDNLLDQVSRGVQVILITDGRYWNEIDYVRDTFPTNSLRIRLVAPKRVQKKLEKDIQVFKDEVQDGHSKQVLDVPATQAAIHKIASHPSEQALTNRDDWDLVLDNDYEEGPYAAQKVIQAIERANILPKPYAFDL